MGRWAHLDTDEERLPEGMVRVGYDADSQVYTFRDTSDGSLWESAPGCEYGRLQRMRDTALPLPTAEVVEAPVGEEEPYVLHDFYGSDVDDDDEEEEEEGHLGRWKKQAEKRTTFLDDASDVVIAAPTKARLPRLRRPRTTSGTKPRGSRKLPSLRDVEKGSLDVDSDNSSDFEKPGMQEDPAPKGQEHRHKRSLERRRKESLARSGTLSRIARFIRRDGSSEAAAGTGGLGRSKTVRTTRSVAELSDAPGSIRRKRATTFDDILKPKPHT